MSLSIPYKADRKRADEILVEAAGRHQVKIDALQQEDIRELQRRYYVISL